MTTAELTKRISALTEPERCQVDKFISELIASRPAPTLKPYTRKEFISAILESHAQAERGELISAEQALAEICEKYGIPA